MRLVAVHKKFGTLLDNMLTQGASPHKVALAIALGGSIGILPVVWGSTVLCALLAYLLRLNQVGIQAANYLTFPLQIALFVPFYRIGAKIFPWGQPVSAEVVGNHFEAGWFGKIPFLLVANLKAIGAWFLVAPPDAVLLYLVFLPICARIPANNPRT